MIFGVFGYVSKHLKKKGVLQRWLPVEILWEIVEHISKKDTFNFTFKEKQLSESHVEVPGLAVLY